ncbi:MAG TPA: hypothetical protein VGG98_11465 [Solirubrobacteraceae bacterium]|jgi:hypothetical protein
MMRNQRSNGIVTSWVSRTLAAAFLVLVLAIVWLAVAAAAFAHTAPAGSSPLARQALAAPPANDNMQSAQVIHGFPTTVGGTTVGATLEPAEVASNCVGQPTASSVWYTLRASAAQRIAVDIAAKGRLDAVIDVYHAVRSQLQSVGCQQTDSEGKASLSFKTFKNGVYEIRVAALQSSQLDAFTLDVFLPTPAVNPPGSPLPSGGAGGHVDRIQNVNAAYSFTLHAGVSYLINLADETKGACVAGALFPPRTSSFEDGSRLVHVGCGGYRLFTPGAGQGGRYSFEVTPSESFRGVQRFHLQVAAAGPSEIAPGRVLGNYARAAGRLDGRGAQVQRLYRIDVTSHSNLTLRLHAPESADFNLQLRNERGNVVECACNASGSQTLQRQLRPGRYYAVVSVRDATAGNFTLTRESRTITSTAISFGTARVGAGQSVGIHVTVSPASSGPVTVKIERFDPVFGWQFYREAHAFVGEGSAVISFTPPAVGRWRANATYGGSRTASPSAVGFTYLLVS